MLAMLGIADLNRRTIIRPLRIIILFLMTAVLRLRTMETPHLRRTPRPARLIRFTGGAYNDMSKLKTHNLKLSQDGFTLVELLVVIAIIAIMFAVILIA